MWQSPPLHCTDRSLPGDLTKEWEKKEFHANTVAIYCNLGHVLHSVTVYITGETVSSGFRQVELITPDFHNLI